MKNTLIILALFTYSISLFGQTKFEEKFSSKNEFDAHYIVKMSNNNYFGYSPFRTGFKGYCFVFDSKLKNLTRESFKEQFESHISFYQGKNEFIQLSNNAGTLYKRVYSYDDEKIKKIKTKLKISSGQIVKDNILYDINPDNSNPVYVANHWFSGQKYDFVSETILNEFENKSDKHKVDEFSNTRLFYLSNGNILLFSAGKQSQNGSFEGFTIQLYTNDLKLIASKSNNHNIWISMGAVSLVRTDIVNNDIIIAWGRDFKTNKMFMFKIETNGSKIAITENKIIDSDITTTYIDEEMNKKGYDNVFKLLVSEMPEDKNHENPGSSYYLDSAYNMGDKFYINYDVFQNIKGSSRGELYMTGVFILDEKCNLIENLATNYTFKDEKQTKDENQLDNCVRSLHSFYSNNKIVYVYTQNLKLKGFEIEDGKEIKLIDEVDIKLPEESRPNLPYETFFIIPISHNSLVLKARLRKQFQDGTFSYRKCNYTFFNLE